MRMRNTTATFAAVGKFVKTERTEVSPRENGAWTEDVDAVL